MIKIHLPQMYPKQEEAIYAPERFSLTVAGTKTGKTLGCASWMAGKAMNNPRSMCWWVAPIYRQAEIGFNRCSDIICPRAGTASGGDKIKLLNGSVIEFRSAEKPSNLYGEAVDFGVLDEADRMRTESWHAYRSTITQTKAPTRMISNPVHARSWFREMWDNEGKDPDIASFKLSTYDNPFIDRVEIDKAKSQLPESVFRSLYEAEWPEAGGVVFRGLHKCLLGQLRGAEKGSEYKTGVDLGKKEDFTVIATMEDNHKELVAIDRFKELSWNIQQSRVKKQTDDYNQSQAWVDGTGLGDPIVEALTLIGISVIPVIFTNSIKIQMIDNLRIAIEQQLIILPKRGSSEVSDILIDEMEIFECVVSPSGNLIYGAPEGYHDDCVWALALACWGLRYKLRTPVVTPGKPRTFVETVTEDMWKQIKEQTRKNLLTSQGLSGGGIERYIGSE